MKSERRHELKQNVLGAELTKAFGFFRTHGKLAAYGVLGIAAVLLVYVWVQKHAQSKERGAQADFTRLVLGGEARTENLPQLEAIVDGDSNEFRAAYAGVTAGDVCVNVAMTGEGTIPAEEYRKALANARSYYDKVIEKFPQQPGAVAKAHMGLGVVAEMEKGLSAARKPVDDAAALKATAVGGVIAQRILQEWDELASLSPMRKTALTPPTTQPAGLLAQADMPIPGVPVPQGFNADKAAPQGAVRFVGGASDLQVVNFYKAEMAQRGWTLAVDSPVGTSVMLVFIKDNQYVAARIGAVSINTQIELRAGTGAVPAEFAAPATQPRPATAPK
ncbi:MAG: hypothetical protein NTV86_14345 [Planctomycetota bacterium]|nr:hypothetical protein [Planctomycetota bacterium]